MLTNLTLPVTPTLVVEGTTTQHKAITCIQVCNISNLPAFGTPVTITINVYAVPNGQAAGQNSLIYSQVPITPGDTYIVDTERMILDAGDAIWAECDTAGAAVMTVSTVGI
jgi:hypothetical protein